MLKIIKGNLNDVKAEMKQASDQKRSEIKTLKQQLKELKNDPQGAQKRIEIQNKIDRLIELKDGIYSSAHVLPVRVGDIVINYKAYPLFEKKIERLSKRISLGNCLTIEYETETGAHGQLDLIDLSSYYEGFKHIPVAVFRDAQS